MKTKFAPTPAGSTFPSNSDIEKPTRRDLRTAVLIALCCLVVYNANLRSIPAGDTYPARYLPFGILKYQTLRLDPIEEIVAQGRGKTAYWIVRLPDGHEISLYPVTLPLLVSPLYLPANAYLHLNGWWVGSLDRAARLMEKATASFLAALSASLLYLLLRRRAARPVALMLTVAYAFGTTTWVISSQALWQHGMAQLLVVGALLFLTAPPATVNVMGAGLLCGVIVANRPPDIVIAAALGAYGLVWARRRAIRFVASAAIPLALLLLYNLGIAGDAVGGYGLKGKPQYVFSHDLASGLAGLLFSPTHGLLVFSPFLLFLGLGWKHLPRVRGERLLTLAMSAAVVLQLLLYAKTDWRGGLSWGPRYLTDLLPLLVWMLVPVVAALRGVAKACFLVALAVSIAIEAIGAWCYTPTTDVPIFAVARGPEKMRAAWKWRNAPFIASLKHGLVPRELAIHVRGTIDELQAGGRVVTAVTAGEQVVASGWALAGERSPLQAGVMIDGQQGPVTLSFFDRPDIRKSASAQALAGWSVSIDTSALAPGEHRIAALAWNSTQGDVYYLGERALTVLEAKRPSSGTPAAAGQSTAVDFDRAFDTASARVRDHQQDDGYWLTTFTSKTRYEKPHPEMNTFLTSIMTDLLDPIAGPAKMNETLRRAREHLTAQIEPGGLVRYHGLPSGPGIGTLGCAITPDTDDTALVWRIAPGRDRRQLASALKTIEQYRTPDGLYRTWLAPRQSFQCIDPGSDPNPPDIAIQMNLLMLLAEADPEAGRALCRSVRAVLDEDRVWVYYRVTPIVAMLRLPDLDLAGCKLEMPEARMRTTVPEQEIWVSAARMLVDARRSQSVDAAQIRALLERLAADDFALLRTNPPLIYHNDLTASVPRYYWSEDFGYALWLRLDRIHDQIERKRPNG